MKSSMGEKFYLMLAQRRRRKITTVLEALLASKHLRHHDSCRKGRRDECTCGLDEILEVYCDGNE